MTPEDKAIIASYMGWKFDSLMSCYRCVGHYSDPVPVHFDLNDAGLCVEKMVEKDHWANFIPYALKICGPKALHMNYYVAWLFNPENFFSAMASWLRSK